ncbi:MAG: uncharacterized protein A8A55_0894 [Amphiamblys sp. WSBS2006]|nr:MAG: uncharacterized protein A8A55_0894 [Amphiamblys sp. WSBS2006]
MNRRNFLFELLEEIIKKRGKERKVPLETLKKELRDQAELSQNECKIIKDTMIGFFDEETAIENICDIQGCIFNILSHYSGLRGDKMTETLLTHLKTNLDRKRILSLLQYNALRIAFMCSTDPKGAAQLTNELRIPEELFDLAHALLRKKTERAFTSLSLCIRMFYNFMVSTPDDKDSARRSLAFAVALFKEEDVPHHVRATGYCLLLPAALNVSDELGEMFPEDPDLVAKIGEDILLVTEELLRDYKETGDEKTRIETLFSETDISAMCCTLKKLAEERESFRKSLSDKIMPYPRNLEVPPEEEETLRGLFGSQLLSKNVEFRKSIGELLFFLCKSKSSRMCYHFGLCRAAGTLLENDMFNVTVEGSFVSSEEEPEDTYPQNYDILAGKIKEEDPAEPIEDEEERLGELCGAIEKHTLKKQ